MAGYVCAVAGGNGGVGKTTTAINLSAVLAADGYDVAVIDADLGMPNVSEMLGVDHEQSLHDILAGRATVSETLTDAPGGMTLIPGEPALEAYAEANPQKLRTVIKTLRRAYDVVVVDTAAGLRQENTVPLALADGVLLLTTPDYVSLTDTTKTGQLATRVDSDILGALIVRVTRETDLGDIEAAFDFPVLGGVPEAFDVAGDEPLVLTAPDSDAADAYRQLTTQLERVFFEGADLDPVASDRFE
ncbi:MinD/ParA family ATP-binding protein [Salinibaculum salinum]|uniref:MinD/ParA family ATP-binding protein n=1 Tax=Salinibaculum salinum TaxID=3131996 RepID=UPI0030ED3501